MKNKRFLSMFLSIVILLSMLPMQALADGYNYNDSRLTGVTDGDESSLPRYTLELFKDDNGSLVKTNAADVRANSDQAFYLGIKTTNFDRFTAMSPYGLSNLTIQVTYNMEYFELEPTNGYADSDTVKDRVKTYATANSLKSLYNTGATKPSSQTGTAVPYKFSAVDTDEVITLTMEPSQQTRMGAMASEEYVGFLEFKIKKTPPDGVGVESFVLGRSSDSNTIALGTGGNKVAIAYNSTSALETMLVLDESEANVFPETYSVNFYNDKNLSEPSIKTVSNVEDGTTVSSNDVPQASEFTAPDGEFFDSLKYFVVTDTRTDADPDNDPEFVPDTGEENPEKTPTKITGNTKVYATYIEGHTVTFNSNYPAEVTTPAATTKPVTVSPKVGSTIPEASKPTVGKATDDPAPDFVTPDGYSFVGWFDTDAATGGNEITFGDGGTAVVRDGSTIDNVYARWAQTVTYTFDLNYTGAPAATTVTKNSGEALGTDAPADPTRTTYDFVGWDTKSNGSGTRYNAANPIANLNASEDTTLYAIWEPKADQDTFTLTFDAVGGTLKNPTSITVVQGDPITAAMMPDNPEKTAGTSGTAYKFEGWFEDASPSNTDKITAPITLTEDTTAYAHWSYDENNPDAVTITFDDQGATTAVTPTTVTIASGDAIGALPTDPEKTGNSFSGWFPNADGTGTQVEATTTFSVDTTVYAKWTQDITVVFDVNTGAGTPQNQSGKPTDKLTLPADGTVTKKDYKLIGWNTKKNGSGEYVDATMTLNDVYTIDGADVDTSASTVTVYAQWADATITDPEPNPPTPPTPDAGGVLVKFNTNASGSADQTGIIDAKPNWKIPKYGDAIGADQMPTDPVRPNYKLKTNKWNTKPDGTGVNVDGTTPIDGATLGDAVVQTEPNKYEVTLYAQWEVDDDQIDDPKDKITVKFNKNTDGKGTDASERIETVFRGDSLGYVPELPTNSANIKASGWFEGTKNATSGMIEFGETASAFTAATAINPAGDATEMTYYSKYEMYLLVQIQEVESIYDGNEKDPKYKVWQIEKPVEGSENVNIIGENPVFGGADGLPFSDASSQFEVNYTTATNATGATLQNADTYTINSVTFKDGAELASQGATIAMINPKTYTIKTKPVAVTLDPDKQKAKKETPIALIDVDDLTIPADALVSGDTKADVLKVTYKLWTDAGDPGDGKIQSSELTDTTPNEVGRFVMEIGTNNPNYTISSVDSSVEGKTVVVYTQDEYPDAYKTDGEGVVTIKTPGTNLVFEVVPNDPSISSIVVNSVKESAVSTDPLGLKQNDYTTDQTFDNAENPAVKDYYVRITDTDADHVQFTLTLTNPDTTIVTASDGATPEGAVVVTPEAGADPKQWTVTAPLTKKGKDPNVITIITKAGNADDAPSITYTFNVQQLVKPEITLNYGNSPYGEIMRDSAITDKEAAKAAFAAGNTFNGVASQYLPTNARTVPTYTIEAWGGSEDGEVNMDRNDYAIFGYEQQEFFDTGFTAKDALGNDITSNIVRTIEIKRLTGTNINEVMTDAHKETITFEAGSSHSLKKIVDDTKPFVRPDVYVMKYTYHDTTLDQDVEVGTRNIIILPLLGDVDIQDGVNNNDTVPIVTQVQRLGNIIDNTKVEEKVANLFLYRVCDTDYQDGVNNNDTVPIVSQVQRIANIVDFYNETTAN